MNLAELAEDFADALAAVDRTGARHKEFQPGIGPFGEADAVREAVKWLKAAKPMRYSTAEIRRAPDLLIPGEWAIELKVIRPFGDNGKPAEHWSQNVLHPYPGNTSSLGDCLKLLGSRLIERKAVVIFGFEHTPTVISLNAAITSFELIAREVLAIELTAPIHQLRTALIHPVHQQLRVFAYEVIGKVGTPEHRREG